MSDIPNAPLVPPADAKPPRDASARRRSARSLFTTIVMVAGVGFTAWYYLLAPHPPSVKLDGVDPAVARAVRHARWGVWRAPRSGEAWGNLASLFYVHDFYNQADECFARAERFDPWNPRWPYLRGRSMNEQDPDRALPILKRAVDLAGDEPSATRLKYGEIVLERGRTEEAAAQFERILKHDPTDPRALLDMGRILLLRAQPKQAAEYLSQSTLIRPDIKQSHTLLAQAYEQMGDEPDAQLELQQAATCHENPLWNDLFLGEALGLKVGLKAELDRAATRLESGKAAEAVAPLEALTREHPDSSHAWAFLAQAYRQSGKPSRADNAAREAVRLSPDSVQALNELGNALFEQDRFAEAEESFRQASHQQPDLADAQFNVGLCRLLQADPAGAVEFFRRAVQCKPNLQVAYHRLGEALLRAGNPAEAIDPLREALRLNGTDAEAENLLHEAQHASAGNTSRPHI